MYGLFVRAVLCNVYPIFALPEDTIPFGPRGFLKAIPKSSTALMSNGISSASTSFQFFELSVQLLASGKLIVICSDRSSDFHSLNAESVAQSTDLREHPIFVSLAPTSQIARFGDDDDEDERNPRADEILSKVAKDRVVAFLQQAIPDRRWSQQDHEWARVQIPTVYQLTQENGSTATEVAWQTIYWPREMCIVVGNSQGKYSEDHEPATPDNIDLLSFVQDWALKTSEQVAELLKGKNQVYQTLASDEDDDLGLDDAPLETHLQAHPSTIMDFAPSQMMYPTPPDGPFTQATPGMMSMDGTDLTPAHMVRSGGESSIDAFNKGTTKVEDMPTSAAESGFYDDDLFEEVPNAKYAVAGTAEEPNWDFFDTPDLDSPDMAMNMATDPGIESPLNNTATNRASELVMNSDQASPSLVQHSARDELQVKEKSVDGEPVLSKNSKKDSPGMIDVIGREGQSPTNDLVPSHGSTLGDLNSSKNRREDHLSDDKYLAANGQYFYSPAQVSRTTLPKPAQTHKDRHFSSSHRPQTPSSGSEDDQSPLPNGKRLRLDGSKVEEAVAPAWAQYVAPPTAVDEEEEEDHNEEEVDRDVQELLKLLEQKHYDLPVPKLDLTSQISISPPLLDWMSDPADQLALAQILVDQVTQSTFQNIYDDFSMPPAWTLSNQSYIQSFQDSDAGWERPVIERFAKQGRNETAETETRVLMLDSINLDLSRLDKPITASSSLFSQWDNLDLQPNAGEKPVLAYCLCPSNPNLLFGCQQLLASLKEVYQGCNFGTFNIGEHPNGGDSGIVSWELDEDEEATLNAVCDDFGAELHLPTDSKEALLILLINPWPEIGSLITLCGAFFQLFSAYRKRMRPKQKASEIVLQIVPASFIATAHSINIPTRRTWIELVVEIYNRCPPVSFTDKLWVCGSAVVLADQIHRLPQFELISEVSSPLSKGGECLHLCYSVSSDRRWVTAAWTDERGSVALTMSYCLKMKGSKAVRTFASIVQEMWETSHDLMAKHRSKWRLIVARVGLFELEELNRWMYQNNSLHSDNKVKCSLVLLSLDLTTPLQLQLPQPQSRHHHPQASISSIPSKDVGTPASTPQATMMSPSDPTAMPVTPMVTPSVSYFPGTTNTTSTMASQGTSPSNADLPNTASTTAEQNTDTDVDLVDPADEFWSVVLTFGLNQSTNLLDSRPAQLSGYLMKRRGAKDEDGISMLGISLLFAATTLIPAPTTQPPHHQHQHHNSAPSSMSGGSTTPSTPGPITPGGSQSAYMMSSTQQQQQQQSQAQQQQQQARAQTQLQAQNAAMAAREELLRDIIAQYRGLVTLAVTRGCLINPQVEVLPWHVSTAYKGAELLRKVM